MARIDALNGHEALSAALMASPRSSEYFRGLLSDGRLAGMFPELAACVGVPQNPAYHPEGDVFEHTMLVVDSAAALRDRAEWPLGFMLSALAHDFGKAVATRVDAESGKITSYGHEVAGLPLCEAFVRRLSGDGELAEYVKNMVWLHMRPNVMAKARSKKNRTRRLFGLSVCPEDLILLSRADASGKLDAPYDEGLEAFLRERLEDFLKYTY